MSHAPVPAPAPAAETAALHFQRKTRTTLALTLLLATVVTSASFAGEIYQSLFTEFTRHDHRLPGSENFKESAAALENVLTGAGLEVHRETFSTLVPDTKECVFTVDGQAVSPVYPLGPNSLALSTTGGETLTGPLVWLGDGSPESWNGKQVDGSIALLELGSRHMQDVFAQGARAVVFVGNDAASQWSVRHHFSEHLFSVPRYYLPRDAADRLGLLTNGPPREASLKATVVWKDVVTENLWVELPGEKGATFSLDAEEAVVLSATLDTFGAVPEYTPQTRWAANAALLAETLVDLSKKPRKRSVFGVFLGSHFSAEEGARYFYYGVDKAEEGGWNTFPLDFREQMYRDELQLIEARARLLRQPDFLTSDDPERFRVTKLLRQKLDEWVNNMNYEIREVVLAQVNAPSDELTAKEDAFKEAKSGWNRLRRQLREREIQPEDQENFQHLVDTTRSQLDQRRGEIELRIAHNLTYQELAKRFENKLVVSHFSFDFARDDAPWMFSPLVAYWAMRDDADTTYIGSYLGSMTALGKVYDELDTAGWRAPLLEDTLRCTYQPYSLAAQAERSGAAACANALGIPGYQLVTVGDPLAHDELPVRSEVNLEGLVGPMSAYLQAVANSPAISLRPFQKRTKFYEMHMYRHIGGDKYKGERYYDLAKGSSDVAGPAKNAVVLASGWKFPHISPILGHARGAIARVNSGGLYFMPMVWDSWTGRPKRAFGFDENGTLTRFPGPQIGRLFYGYGGGFFKPFKPRLQGVYGSRVTSFLNARTDSKEKYEIGMSGKYHDAFYMGRDVPFKYIGSSGITLLGSLETNPQGYGYPLGANHMVSMNVVRLAAHDYSLLNQSRLEILRRKNIVNDAIESLHADARQHIEEAGLARAALATRKAAAHETFAVALGNRAYEPLKGITNDLVQAVVVLLLLNIPFAFALERLLFGFPSIYKQVAGFVGIFVTTFLILYLVHPAFSLAAAPIIIFLAFVIIVMSAVVIYIIMTKFRLELRSVQGLASTAHGAAADSSTAMASVVIGISGMRNRPIKTLLTATTVVLLTFTILVFASFSSKVGVVETYLGKGQGEDRIEVHRFSFLEIPRPLGDAIKSLYQDRFDVFFRAASFFDPSSDDSARAPERMVYYPAGKTALKMAAVLGLDPEECVRNPALDEGFPGFKEYEGEHPPLYLSEAAVKHLGIKHIGEELRIFGQVFLYAGVLDPARVQEVSNIDYTQVVPPNFEAILADNNISKDQGADKGEDAMEKVDTSSFIWVTTDNCAMTTVDAVASLGGVENFVSLYPHEDADVETAANEIAAVFDGPIYGKSPQGAKQFFFTKAVEGSGFSETLVPLLLGGLIIFSSLLGSIVDREKEIFTYSALGLAPPNVGALFFAESCVYAVVGGLGGYLFSQLVAKLLAVLSSFGLFHPPEMNFSSFASVLTILIVMATVLLSTIFPAMKASKSANPGVARKWKMPAPDGNFIRFIFPFTVSATDLKGILNFIREHFENHGDASLGAFAAKEVEVFQSNASGGSGASMGIQAMVSLAPFDLGVFQRFRMYSKPSEIEGIDEVVVELEKVNGAPGAWVRGNRPFIDDLRNQFLLWRSLPPETTDLYKARAE